MSWLQQLANGGLILNLHVQPGAKRSELVGLHGEALKIRLAAPPIEGKANTALITFLADLLGVPKAAISLEAGASSRRKRVRVDGASAQALKALRIHAEQMP